MIRRTVRGHWRGVWTLNPRGRQVLGEKAKGQKVYYKVLTHIAPFWRGNIEPPEGAQGKKYRVTMSQRPIRKRLATRAKPPMLAEDLDIDPEYEKAREEYWELLTEYPGAFGSW